jgi:aryl-alcohol dehydrogenase-like predicted oxidoreductase
MAEKGMTFVAFSPLSQGLLLDKFDPYNPPQFEEGDNRRGRHHFETENLLALKPKLAKLKARFGDSVEDLAGVALRYVLNMPNVACAIPGFRNERQVKANLAGVTRQLSEEDMQFIKDALA